MQHRYGLAPFVPYNSYPTAAHPPAVGCQPQAGMTGRGGLFEGPTLNDAGNICGARTGTGPVVPMVAWPDVAQWQRHPTGASRSMMPIYPGRTAVPFSPTRLTLGMGDANMPASAATAKMMPTPIRRAGQSMDPASVRNNRTRPVWTGPDTSPEGFTPRGGILDGSSLRVGGQWDESVYYDATRPRVVGTGVQIQTLPNPSNDDDSLSFMNTTPGYPMAGFGAGEPSRPEATPRMIGQGGSERARRPAVLGRSVFQGRVYENGLPLMNITPGYPMAGYGAGPRPISWIEAKIRDMRRAFNGSPDGLSGVFRGFGSLLGFE